MSLNDDTSEINKHFDEIKKTNLFKFITYLNEKNPDARKFSTLKEEFPNYLKDSTSLAYLIEQGIIWIEMNGTVRAGGLAEGLYTITSKVGQWNKKGN